MDIDQSYKKYFADRSFERRNLLKKIVDKYNIKSALYPGSYTHVTPSFYIPDVIYVDSDSIAKRIFAKSDEVQKFISDKKTYPQNPKITFIGQSYFEPLPIDMKVDFLFSQYAGPISQACKSHLKKDGILVVNNSHADAGIAHLDPDYKLIGVAKKNEGKVSIAERNLEDYFQPKKEEKTLSELMDSGKGIGYTKTADNYIFQKIN